MTDKLIYDFKDERDCIYRDEIYSVRDNGSVLRHPPNGNRPRPTDSKWTFGKQNGKTGYMEIATARVHRIVATAFHGIAPTTEHVVDHIDTNRCNNRPENLRWLNSARERSTQSYNGKANRIDLRKYRGLSCKSVYTSQQPP